MSRAYVLMTAMPPTKGHQRLIEFAAQVGSTAEVVVCTQPGEPFVYERVEALQELAKRLGNVNVHHIHRTLPQEPEEATGFWDMWLDFLLLFGLQKTDYIVASERYGMKLAEISGATFIPYDLDRSVYYSKATDVRNDPIHTFDSVLPEFQKNLRFRVTVFGAESCGKTTLSRYLARGLKSWFLPEWARPYLETVGPELTRDKMQNIWRGQTALQDSASSLLDSPFIIQDTDLFSTYGYWKMHPELGETPSALFDGAKYRKSDLYIIAPSNIPFEPDVLRYGGDKREGSDEYWTGIAQEAGLNTYTLKTTTKYDRANESLTAIKAAYNAKIQLKYDRIGA